MPKYIVRYGAMRNLGVMGCRTEAAYKRGMEVIVRSNRGLEVGQVLCEAQDDSLAHLDGPPTGQILREISSEDAGEVAHLDGLRDEKTVTVQRHIDDLGLDMKLVEIEQLFGGERMIVYYLAEERVDFRQLVKNLAGEFQTRIEMKQIGVRDEAKLLADYGDCGKPVCCANHLVTMPPVSMKMAKLQKATLDPTKISGRCGRLKCCLRYEFDHYEAVERKLPRVGSHIVTKMGRMKVLSQEILAEQLLVESEDHRRMVIDATEVLSVIKNESSRSDSKNRGNKDAKGGGKKKKQGKPNKPKNPAAKQSKPSKKNDPPKSDDA